MIVTQSKKKVNVFLLATANVKQCFTSSEKGYIMAAKRSLYNEDKANAIFAVKIRKLFEESGKTHNSLAEYIKQATGESVTRQAVGQWCSGNTCPNLRTVPIIADFFGVSTDYLLTDVEVRTTDAELKAVCEYTGLSDKAIKNICSVNEDVKSAHEISAAVLLSEILESNLLFSFVISAITAIEWLNKANAEELNNVDSLGHISQSDTILNELPNCFISNIRANEAANIFKCILDDVIAKHGNNTHILLPTMHPAICKIPTIFSKKEAD